MFQQISHISVTEKYTEYAIPNFVHAHLHTHTVITLTPIRQNPNCSVIPQDLIKSERETENQISISNLSLL